MLILKENVEKSQASQCAVWEECQNLWEQKPHAHKYATPVETRTTTWQSGATWRTRSKGQKPPLKKKSSPVSVLHKPFQNSRPSNISIDSNIFLFQTCTRPFLWKIRILSPLSRIRRSGRWRSRCWWSVTVTLARSQICVFILVSKAIIAKKYHYSSCLIQDHLNLAFTVPLTTPPWVYLAHTFHWACDQKLCHFWILVKMHGIKLIDQKSWTCLSLFSTATGDWISTSNCWKMGNSNEMLIKTFY